jgi:hypothetical protein
MGKMTNKDHRLLDEAVGHVLDGYKSGKLERLDAIDKIAQISALIDNGNDYRSYLKAILDPEAADMPRGPRGEKRPADLIGNAVRVARIATGEEEDDREATASAAATLGKLGGAARARNLTAEQRAEIAKKAAKGLSLDKRVMSRAVSARRYNSIRRGSRRARC